MLTLSATFAFTSTVFNSPWIPHDRRPCPVTPNTQFVKARAHTIGYLLAVWAALSYSTSRRRCRVRRLGSGVVVHAVWAALSGSPSGPRCRTRRLDGAIVLDVAGRAGLIMISKRSVYELYRASLSQRLPLRSPVVH